MRLQVADLQVELQGAHPDTEATAAPYAVPPVGDADILISPEHYRTLPMRLPATTSPAIADYFYSEVVFARRLLCFSGLVLHASAVVLNGRAYLFSAPSGTGKSTHTKLWCETFPGAYILNDDKPAIRMVDGEIYVYGTPWAGKCRTQRNERVPLGGICVLERGETDSIRRMSTAEAMVPLYEQIGHRFLDEEAVSGLLSLLGEILARVPICRLTCTPTPHAAEVARAALVDGFGIE